MGAGGMLVVALAAAAAVVLTGACREVAIRIGLLAYPNPIVAQHVTPVPYLGGAAVALAALTTVGLARWYPPLHPSQAMPSSLLVVGSFAFLVLGLVDDVRPLPAFRKLGLQTALAFTLLLGLHPATRDGVSGLLWAVVGTLWVVTVTNAVNVTDVCDGLVASLACIALAAIALTHPGDALWATALLGSCAGFLVLNWPPARIYLGDAGSHLLGYSLAIMTLPDQPPSGGGESPGDMLFGPLLLGVFLFELSFITKMRLNKGLKWWKGSPDHFALRLQAVGFSKASTVAGAWAAAVPPTLAAVGVQQHVGPAWRLSLLGVVGLEAAVAWRWLRTLDALPAE
jgi:UDP-GlcNAc:undecaprenyl-phosphate GlcNAc-1-phosphate transferase